MLLIYWFTSLSMSTLVSSSCGTGALGSFSLFEVFCVRYNNMCCLSPVELLAIDCFLVVLGFLCLVFFFPILPSLLYVWRMALDVENLIPNSLAASLMVTSLEITRLMNFSLTSWEMIEYFFLECF